MKVESISRGLYELGEWDSQSHAGLDEYHDKIILFMTGGITIRSRFLKLSQNSSSKIERQICQLIITNTT